jgi:hypothetical protein
VFCRYSASYLPKENFMYIYDRKLSGAQFLLKEQPITSRPAQRNSYYPDRVKSEFLGRGGSSGSYVWTSEGLGEICVSPGVSRNDPTALNLSPVGTSDFNVIMDVRGTRHQVKGYVVYPGQRSGVSVPFNTSAVPGGKAPIVFIAHGHHATFRDPQNHKDERGANPGGRFESIPSYKGYEYLQKLLARMGIISVSVDWNQFNGDESHCATNINLVADLVLGAIKHFQSLHLGRDPTFGGHIDFSSVGLMGHSRGGEVALLVPELLAQSSTGISGVTVKGVLCIAPTDCRATLGKPNGFAFMTILPAADLDVFTNDGAKFYDQASANPFKCQLYVYDANHNFFNTEWILDDRDEWDARTRSVISTISRKPSITVMDKEDQQAILKAYGCAFFRTVLHGHKRRLAGHQMRKFLEGLEIPPGVKRFRDIHISFECFESLERRRSTTVDDNEGPDIRQNTLRQTNTWAGGLTAQRCQFAQRPACILAQIGGGNKTNKTFFGDTRGMVARSSLKSGRFKWVLGGTMDLSGREIRIRAAEVYDGLSVPAGATGFKLGLADAQDKRGFVDSDDVGGLPRPFDRGDDFTATMLKTLRFPVSCIAARAERGFDPTKVRAIVLWMDRNDGREIAFDQLQIV